MMSPLVSTAIIFALVCSSLAQRCTTTTLYIPKQNVVTERIVASIVGSNSTATTYALYCGPGTPRTDCAFDVLTLIEGPVKAKYTIAPENFDNGALAFTGDIDCSLAGTTSAVCVESYGGAVANSPGVATVTYSGAEMIWQPVAITSSPGAGSCSLPNPPAPSTRITISMASKTASSTDNASTATNIAGPATVAERRWVWGVSAIMLAMIA